MNTNGAAAYLTTFGRMLLARHNDELKRIGAEVEAALRALRDQYVHEHEEAMRD